LHGLAVLQIRAWHREHLAHPVRRRGKADPVPALADGQGGHAARPSAVSRGGTHLGIAERRCRVTDGRALQLDPAFRPAAALRQGHEGVIQLDIAPEEIGFSGMEMETLVRYNFPVKIVVLNNGGIGPGMPEIPDNPMFNMKPNSLIYGARYGRMMEAFGGKGFFVEDPKDLKGALADPLTALPRWRGRVRVGAQGRFLPGAALRVKSARSAREFSGAPQTAHIGPAPLFRLFHQVEIRHRRLHPMMSHPFRDAHWRKSIILLLQL
jgi:hypothetical protein